MAKYLLDTSTIIWVLRGKEQTVRLVDKLKEEAVPGCSALSIYEVLVGVRRGEEEKTNQFLQALHVYQINEKVASLAAEYARRYRSKGKILNPLDAMIAATCLANDLILVTYDLQDYPMPELRLYQTVS